MSAVGRGSERFFFRREKIFYFLGLDTLNFMQSARSFFVELFFLHFLRRDDGGRLLLLPRRINSKERRKKTWW